MNPGVFPLIVLAAVLITITVSWPRFWDLDEQELPFDAEDETRGNWEQIPHQGHPPDIGLKTAFRAVARPASPCDHHAVS